MYINSVRDGRGLNKTAQPHLQGRTLLVPDGRNMWFSACSICRTPYEVWYSVVQRTKHRVVRAYVGSEPGGGGSKDQLASTKGRSHDENFATYCATWQLAASQPI